MKYIEELKSGDIFLFEDGYFLVTSDYKNSHNFIYRMCVSIRDGFVRWLKDDTIVEQSNLYTIDKDKNIIPLKS